MVEAIVSVGMLMWMTGDVDNGTLGLAAAAHMRSQRYSSLGEAAEPPQFTSHFGRLRRWANLGHAASVCCGCSWLAVGHPKSATPTGPEFSSCGRFRYMKCTFLATCAARRALAGAHLLRRPSRPAALALLVLLHHQHHLPSLVTNHTSTDVYVRPG